MAIYRPSRATGKLFGANGSAVSFGFITDTHHDPIKATDTGKYYQDSAEKVADIVGVFDANNDLSFVYENGDWIDGSASQAAALADLAEITAVFAACNKPQYHCIGNHDVYRLTKAQVISVTGQPANYYSFESGKVTFIVLDGNFTANYDSSGLENSVVTGNPGPYVSYIPPTQLAWLEAKLAASVYPCVILCHYPIYYSGANSWGLTNAAAVRTILEAAGDKVIGCIGGHLHDNYIRKVNGITYANIHATVTNAYPALNYAIVSVYPSQREIKLVSAGVDMSYIAA